MIAETIRELQRALPFEPYTVYTSYGKALYIKHPDYSFMLPNNQTIWIFLDEVHREAVATRNITRVVPGRKRNSSGKR
jgi:hypothetical protein